MGNQVTQVLEKENDKTRFDPVYRSLQSNLLLLFQQPLVPSELSKSQTKQIVAIFNDNKKIKPEAIAPIFFAPYPEWNLVKGQEASLLLERVLKTKPTLIGPYVLFVDRLLTTYKAKPPTNYDHIQNPEVKAMLDRFSRVYVN